MEPIFALRRVCFEYENGRNRISAVRDAEGIFEEKKMYAIVGKSGSGKSTLLGMLAGMRLPTEGTVLYRGKDMREIDREAYRRTEIAIIHQAYHLFPRLTALENVCYPLELLGVSYRQSKLLAGEKLLALGISQEQWNSYPTQLSGGEQQRVAIARALAKGSKVILADEPTGNLDQENSEHIMGLLRKLVAEEGYCMILVTHDKEAAGQADVTLYMEAGRLNYT